MIDIARDTWTAGGAANVAINAASLGAHCTVIGFFGSDANGARLQFAPEAGGPSGATTHPVINALDVLRDLYARKAYTLPDRIAIRLGRVWRDAIDGYDRHKALLAFE